MSFFKSTLILALAAAASAQSFSNTTASANRTSTATTPSGFPTVLPGTTTNPYAVPTGNPSSLTAGGKTWKYLGCAANGQGFPGFVTVASSLANNVNTCLVNCGQYEFAGLNGPNCYCASRSDNSTTFTGDAACGTPCPGNSADKCGGFVSVAKRQVAAGMLLSLYQVVVVVPGVSVTPAITATAVIPVAVYTTIIATQYVTVCPTGLTTVAYTTTMTLTHCGCTNITPAATVAMTTTVASCGCGPGGAIVSYTVTVPATATAAKTTAAATTTAVKFTGAGNSIQAGSMLGALGAIVALVL